MLAASCIGMMTLPTSATAAERTLTVYTYESFTSEWGPGPAIKAGFEEQCGDCSIDFVALDSSAGILNRVQLEGDSSRADVVLGLDTNLMAIAEDSGLLADSEVDTSSLTLPVKWESDIFVPFDYGYFAFVYDTEALATPPTSFEELINAPDEVKIIIQDPRTSTPGLGLLMWMKSVYGDKAAEKWQALQPRILTVTKGWSESYFSLFLNGEAPMVLSYSTSPGYHMEIDKTERYQAASFSDGHYLQIEVAALLKRSENLELGREFLSYLTSKEAQTSIPLGNVMYPVVDLGDQLPASFDKLIEPVKTLQFSPLEVKDNRKQWINEWLEASTAG
ncbi:Thiamine-binding periplasmic protein [Granulosicoccus antarcticus IMCC3135]|uniref:Thiamine-binding periplasmic protein n=2 Tax=Granulosicoccus TaxID=437504 RepID=A0A2Z2NYU0_9GAMM|nr:Thiamine-binding periplasmic protein [Granulosicoccus antarcticus IMCC3135]